MHCFLLRREGGPETPEVCCRDPSLGLQRQPGDAAELVAGLVPWLAAFPCPRLHVGADRGTSNVVNVRWPEPLNCFAGRRLLLKSIDQFLLCTGSLFLVR